MTVVDPGCQKGPHLHQVRRGRFTCIKGNVEIITRRCEDTTGNCLYAREWTGEDHGYVTVHVPSGVAAEIINHGDEPAYVLNMPTPAWRPDSRDEWEVMSWNPPPCPR